MRTLASVIVNDNASPSRGRALDNVYGLLTLITPPSAIHTLVYRTPLGIKPSCRGIANRLIVNENTDDYKSLFEGKAIMSGRNVVRNIRALEEAAHLQNHWNDYVEEQFNIKRTDLFTICPHAGKHNTDTLIIIIKHINHGVYSNPIDKSGNRETVIAMMEITGFEFKLEFTINKWTNESACLKTLERQQFVNLTIDYIQRRPYHRTAPDNDLAAVESIIDNIGILTNKTEVVCNVKKTENRRIRGCTANN